MEHIGNNKVDANTESGKPRLFITTGNQALTKGKSGTNKNHALIKQCNLIMLSKTAPALRH